MNINTDIFKIQSNNVMPSRGKILISEPFLHDVTFGRSVVLLVDHTEEGSMGLIINKPLPLMLNDIIKEFKYIEDIPLHKGGPIGTDTLFYLHTLHSRGAVGIAVHSNYRQEGYASDALKLLCEYAFNFLFIKQLYAHIAVDNEPSLRLFNSCGFTQCGVLKEWLLTHEGYKDAVLVQCMNPKR